MELQTNQPLSARSLELLKEIERIFVDPRAWLEMHNSRLMGERPIDLIGTPDEDRVRNIIESYIYGLYS